MQRIAIFAIFIIFSPSVAVGDIYDDCNKSDDLQLKIKGCTEIIKQVSDKRTKSLAYEIRARAHKWGRNYDLAIADLSKAIGLRPNNAELYSDRAWVKFQKDSYEDALIDNAKAIELNSNEVEYYRQRGRIYLYLKRPEKALEVYTKIISLKPGDKGAYLSRIEINRSIEGRNDRVIRDYTTLLKISKTAKEKAIYFLRRGKIHARSNDARSRKLAIQDLRRAEKSESQRDSARDRLARLGEKPDYFNIAGGKLPLEKKPPKYNKNCFKNGGDERLQPHQVKKFKTAGEDVGGRLYFDVKRHWNEVITSKEFRQNKWRPTQAQRKRRLDLLRKAAAKNNLDALYDLAMDLRAAGDANSKAASLSALSKAASRGHVKSQFMMAYRYASEKDDGYGECWLEQLARHASNPNVATYGPEFAFSIRSLFILADRAVEKDLRTAHSWIQATEKFLPNMRAYEIQTENKFGWPAQISYSVISSRIALARGNVDEALHHVSEGMKRDPSCERACPHPHPALISSATRLVINHGANFASLHKKIRRYSSNAYFIASNSDRFKFIPKMLKKNAVNNKFSKSTLDRLKKDLAAGWRAKHPDVYQALKNSKPIDR